ncbi:S49 family peptidase [Hymenobacter sp. BT186]|uniref:S49 family peptidase n=2 Tax=Hymenobacter telluris TaxID=2816474 RepID=A0A939JB88_9BACT|nr:S49 family peptidase [Hymenobacter telluris]MBW3376696.1 S49 family peptidase [Hymenobacter norwichensis]
MRVNALLFAVLNGYFLLEASAIQNYLPLAEQMREGKFRAADWMAAGVELEVAPPTKSFLAITPFAESGVLSYEGLDEVPAGSIAVYTIEGVMMEADTCWSLGTASLGQLIREADAHENIIAHVGRFNTPGGSTMGLESFAGIIAGTQKPFVSHATQMCSAGYWAGSGANAIVVNGRTAMIGSIGTMVSFRDYSKANARLGIEDHVINATASTNKNAAFSEAQKGNYKPIRAQLLDPLNEVFLSTVRENRAGKLDAQQEKELLSGMVYIGEANVSNGLADQMGSFEDAVALAQQLAEEAATSGGSAAKNATTSSNSTNTMSLFNKKTLTLGAAMVALVAKQTVSAEEAAAANTELEAANITGAKLITEAAFTDLEAKGARVDAAEKEATDAKAATKTATDELATVRQEASDSKASNEQLTKDLEAATKRAEDAEAEATRLGNLSGATPTFARKSAEKNDVEEEGDTKSTAQILADLPHNKALDNNPLFN